MQNLRRQTVLFETMFSDVVFDSVQNLIFDPLQSLAKRKQIKDAFVTMLACMNYVIMLSDEREANGELRNSKSELWIESYQKAERDCNNLIPSQQTLCESIQNILDSLEPDYAYPEIYDKQAIINMLSSMNYLKKLNEYSGNINSSDAEKLMKKCNKIAEEEYIQRMQPQ